MEKRIYILLSRMNFTRSEIEELYHVMRYSKENDIVNYTKRYLPVTIREAHNIAAIWKIDTINALEWYLNFTGEKTCN